jgi:hypothetical protein
VQGIDASQAMVGRLRAKPGGEEIRVTIADMAEASVTGPFRLAYLVFIPCSACSAKERQADCFRWVWAVACLILIPLGGITYLLLGRVWERGGSPA